MRFCRARRLYVRLRAPFHPGHCNAYQGMRPAQKGEKSEGVGGAGEQVHPPPPICVQYKLNLPTSINFVSRLRIGSACLAHQSVITYLTPCHEYKSPVHVSIHDQFLICSTCLVPCDFIICNPLLAMIFLSQGYIAHVEGMGGPSVRMVLTGGKRNSNHPWIFGRTREYTIL